MAAFLWGVAADLYWLRMLTKPLPVLAMAAWVTTTCQDGYARRVTAGLLLCASGDVLLEASDATFLPGVGAFLLGHLFYTAAFWGDSRVLRPWRALPFVAWGVAAFVVVLPGLRDAGMTLPVALYISVICTMMWRAVARWHPGEGLREDILAAAVGAILFGLSDTLIALDRFQAPLAGVRYSIILLYWLGQLGIAASVKRHPG